MGGDEFEALKGDVGEFKEALGDYLNAEGSNELTSFWVLPVKIYSNSLIIITSKGCAIVKCFHLQIPSQ